MSNWRCGRASQRTRGSSWPTTMPASPASITISGGFLRSSRRWEWDNILIIFTGDNGLSLGEHGLFGKQNLYEFGGMHVPCVMAGPGIRPGLRLSQMLGTHALLIGLIFSKLRARRWGARR